MHWIDTLHQSKKVIPIVPVEYGSRFGPAGVKPCDSGPDDLRVVPSHSLSYLTVQIEQVQMQARIASRSPSGPHLFMFSICPLSAVNCSNHREFGYQTVHACLSILLCIWYFQTNFSSLQVNLQLSLPLPLFSSLAKMERTTRPMLMLHTRPIKHYGTFAKDNVFSSMEGARYRKSRRRGQIWLHTLPRRRCRLCAGNAQEC